MDSQTGHCHLRDLAIYVRTYNGLVNANLMTTEQICAKTPRELLKLKNFGAVSLADITGALAERGLTLAAPLHGCPFCRCERYGQ